MYTKHLFFIGVLLSFFLNIKAQTLTSAEFDSLMVVWNNPALPDTIRLQAIHKISWDGYRDTNPDSSYYYAQLQYDLSEATGQKKWMGSALNTLGQYKLSKGDPEQALEYYSHSIKIFEELGNKKLLATGMNNIGIVYQDKGDLVNALEYFLKALPITEEIKNKEITVLTLRNIGMVYYKQGNYDQALIYLYKSSKICEGIGDLKGQASAQKIIGAIYKQQGDQQSALEIFTRNLEIYIKIDFKQAIAGTLTNIGSIYRENGEYEKALEYLNRSLNISKESGNKEGVAIALATIAGLYETQGNYNKALSFGTRALALSQVIGNIQWTNYISQVLLISYRETGQYKKALEMADLILETKDSLISQQNQKAMITRQIRYENDKKAIADSLKREKANLILQHEHEHEIIVKGKESNIILGIGILILFIAIGLWSRLNYIRRTNIVIEKEKSEAQKQQLRAEQSEAFKQLFFSNISHEFRTPLTLILGPLDRIINTLKSEQQKQELLLVRRNAQRLQSLINQLLSLSKIESGKMTLKTRPENIVKLTRLFVDSFHSLAEDRGINIDFESHKEEQILYVDTLKFEKIVNNLLSNALKFTKSGGKIKVSVSLAIVHIDPNSLKEKFAELNPPFEEGLKGVLIKFCDTGIGIRRERSQHIFDRFYQADNQKVHPDIGIGIGLALTKELVELHHGKIMVDSEFGIGTTFTVFLPLGNHHLMEDEIYKSVNDTVEMEDEILQDVKFLVHEKIAKKTIQEEEVMNSKNMPLLLIVEDNEDMRAYIKSYLVDHYQVLEASNGKEGAEMAIQYLPDLIVSDIIMPFVDGNEMTNQLKNDEKTSHIPIILLTAKVSEESKLEALETGADDFLTKPFDANELLIRVKNLIEQRIKLRKLLSQHIGDAAQTNLIKESSGRAMSKLDVKFLEKVKDLTGEHMSNPDFSVEMLAQEMSMSRVQLHRKLKNLVDLSVSDLIRDIRLIKAAELLREGELNVTQVTYEIGLSGLSNFGKSFKEKYGVTPSDYAKIP
ncbi:MAG: tetratricopeptide repeat protein [Bacteroidetes bacterium]|nr:tetratricopeptide repeat protein [Bacteroidota bacterium]